MTNGTVECSECNGIFKNKNSLGHHKRSFHMNHDGDDSDSDASSSTDVLSVDGSNSPFKPRKSANLRFECPQCSRPFKNKTTLSNHKKFFHKKTKVASKPDHSDMDQSSQDEDESRTNRNHDSATEGDTDTEKSTSEHSNMSTDSENDMDSEKGQTYSCIDSDGSSDDDDMETDSKSKIVSNHPPVNPKIKRLYQSRAVKKIFKKQNMTPERMGKALKMCSDMDCIEIDEYLKVFEMMRENKIDEIIENNKYLEVIHVLFNGLKEGWIPICGLHLVKLDVHTDDAGKSMFELIDKFKNDLSKKKMVALISKNKELICDTFDRFTEPMMHYIELRKNYLNGFQARFE